MYCLFAQVHLALLYLLMFIINLESTSEKEYDSVFKVSIYNQKIKYESEILKFLPVQQ